MATNTSGVEKEVGELLQSFVRILKPKRVLETGSGKGISSTFIARGLKENGFGILDTIEFAELQWKDAEELWKSLDLSEFIQLHKVRVESFNPIKEYEFIFLDSEPELRFGELVRFYPYLKQGGYVFIHDLPQDFSQNTHNPDHPEVDPWPFGLIPKQVQEWLEDKALVKFHFPNPRGMVGFYRSHWGDIYI